MLCVGDSGVCSPRGCEFESETGDVWCCECGMTLNCWCDDGGSMYVIEVDERKVKGGLGSGNV